MCSDAENSRSACFDWHNFSSDVVDSPDFVPKLNNVERGQALGWLTRRHVTFGGSVVTLGIRVTGLLVILCGWSGIEGLGRQLACRQGCPAV